MQQMCPQQQLAVSVIHLHAFAPITDAEQRLIGDVMVPMRLSDVSNLMQHLINTIKHQQSRALEAGLSKEDIIAAADLAGVCHTYQTDIDMQAFKFAAQILASTQDLVPPNSDQGHQAMLSEFAKQMQLRTEARVQRAKRRRLISEQQARTAAQEATARLQQSAPAGRHHGSTRAAARACNPGGRSTPASCGACKQPRTGHPKSGCPTHCMKCKKLKDDCLCQGGATSSALQGVQKAAICVCMHSSATSPIPRQPALVCSR